MSDTLSTYDVYCKEQKLRPSAPRRLVLDIMLTAEKPLTAYEILEALGAHIKNPKPPTVYRALEALSAAGFVHRIESLNAYIVCDENHRHHGGQFLICESCRAVQEIHLCSIPDSLAKMADKRNFKLAFWNAELYGRCKECV
jgi:Fur family zinc uptake transcriptional regulator